MAKAFSSQSEAASQARSVGPVLLIGGGGMVGRAWKQLLAEHEIEFVAPSSSELDLTQTSTIGQFVTADFPIVVNCAAWTDVDGAETHIEEARALNALAVNELAVRCGRVGATLIHYSTDYIFNGQGDQPYPVNAPTDPVNKYGETKLLGEVLLEQAGCRYLLVRTSWVYAPWGQNFVKTIAKICRERDSLQVVDDQSGRPTSAEHLAATSLSLLQAGATGVFHVCDDGEATWYEFAKAIVDAVNPACEVSPCGTDAFPRPAPRPRYSVLSLTKTVSEIGPLPNWRDNLKAVLPRLES